MHGLLFATRTEARPFIEGLNLTAIENAPVRAFGGKGILAAASGIGKINGAVATAWMITAYKPDLIINFGSAGAASADLSVGDIRQIDHIIDWDNIDYRTGKMRFFDPDTFTGLPAASLATVVNAVLDPLKKKDMSTNADLIDMEASAVVQACRRMKTRAHVIKIVSDPIEVNDTETVIKNITDTAEILFEFFVREIQPLLIQQGHLQT